MAMIERRTKRGRQGATPSEALSQLTKAGGALAQSLVPEEGSFTHGAFTKNPEGLEGMWTDAFGKEADATGGGGEKGYLERGKEFLDKQTQRRTQHPRHLPKIAIEDVAKWAELGGKAKGITEAFAALRAELTPSAKAANMDPTFFTAYNVLAPAVEQLVKERGAVGLLDPLDLAHMFATGGGSFIAKLGTLIPGALMSNKKLRAMVDAEVERVRALDDKTLPQEYAEARDVDTTHKMREPTTTAIKVEDVEYAEAGLLPEVNVGEVLPLAKVNFRGVGADEAIDMARQGMHLKQDPKTGKFIGGPAGVTSIEELQSLRRAFDRLLDEGVFAREWYLKSKGDIRHMIGRDPETVDAFTSTLGQYSQQTPPPTNLGFALKANEQRIFGRQGRIKTDEMDDLFFEQILKTGRANLGPKTGVYTDKLMDTGGNAAVNDIWHARNWGFVDKDGNPWDAALSKAQHAWIDGETLLAVARANKRRAGGYDDWDVKSAQAAPWVAAKGADLAATRKNMTLEQGYEEAAKTYGDLTGPYRVYETFESTSGVGLGGVDLSGLSPEAKKIFTDSHPTWRDQEGRDILRGGVGATAHPSQKMTGAYLNPEGNLEVNVGESLPVLAGQVKTPEGKQITEQGKAMLNAMAAIRAYFDIQHMGAWHRIVPVGPTGAKSAVSTSWRIEGPKGPMHEKQMEALARELKPFKIDISDTGDGVSLMNFGGGQVTDVMQEAYPAIFGKKAKVKDPETDEWPTWSANDARRFVDYMGETLEQHVPGAEKIERGRLEAGNVMHDWDVEKGFLARPQGKREATQELFENLEQEEIPGIIEMYDNDVKFRRRILAKLSHSLTMMEKLDLPMREDMLNAYRLVYNDDQPGGLTKLYEAMKSGKVLPAVGVPLIAASMAEGDQPQ